MIEPIESFLNYLTVEKGYSEHTIAAYRNDLTALADFAQKRPQNKVPHPAGQTSADRAC